jgi:hypothetical protein
MGAPNSSTVLGVRRPRWLSTIEGIQRVHMAMALWGLAVGLAAALVLFAVAPHEWPVLGSRAAGMRAALAVLGEGGPLLAGRHGARGSYYAVAFGDDPGIFVYFPWLGHLFGGVDPVVMLSYFYVAVVAALAAVYPSIFYSLTRSLLAGFAAPIMLVACMLAIGFNDIYWIPAWGMLALLPLLYLLDRNWPPLGLAGLVAVCFAAGWLSSIRSSSGVGILVIAAIILVMRRWRWWRVLPALALLMVAYLFTSTFDMAIIRGDRDHQLGVRAMPDDQVSEHQFYHTAYIGLGYLHNPYGIRYKDAVAGARVQKEAPGTVYGSSRYEAVIRHAYFAFIRDHPLEAVRQYGAKLVVEIADTGPYLLLVLLTLPAMLLLGAGRRVKRRWALLTIPAVLVGLLSPIVAIPGDGYEAELFGALGTLGILGICWALACVESSARRRGGLSFTVGELHTAWSTYATRRGPVRTSMRVSALTITALALLCTGGYLLRQSAARWQGTSLTVLQRYLGALPNRDA